MEVSRRSFLKGTLVGGAGFSLLGFDLTPAVAQLKELKIARATETRSTCPYCAVSCGVLIYTIGDKAKNVTPQVIHVEGDPDHPINRGTLCPKGASLEQDIMNPRRLLKPQVRRPGSDHWEDIAWAQAIDEIAHRVKKTRDDTFIEKRVQLSRGQDHAQPGPDLHGKPGQGLTRPHGLKFGTHIWTRGHDQWLDRH
jgi:formate dehydrogenase major subunit